MKWKIKNNLIYRTVAVMTLCLAVCIETLAAAKAGDATVDVNGTTTISLASAYQNTLKNSTVSTYKWSTTSDKVKITSQSAYSCTIKGVSNGTAQVDYYCSYWIDGNYRTMDFYYTVTINGGSQPLTISPSSITLSYIGATATVKATQNGTVGGVYFTSSDKTVATVGDESSSGYTTSATVTAVGSGTTYIYAHNMKGEDSESACKVTVTISKEYQSLALDELPTFTYGDDNKHLPAKTLEGLALSWSSDNSSVATIDGRELSIKGAGTATIEAYNSGNSSYYPFDRSYTLTVNKASLTITANDVSRAYGEENPPLTVSYSGFVNGEDESVLITKPTVTTTATADSPAGTYPIIASGATAANYDMTYVEGTLTVEDVSTPPVMEVSIAIGSNGVRTYRTPQALDFSSVEGVKAYIATAYCPSSSSVLLTEVSEVPAGTGLILIGSEGEHCIPATVLSPWCVNMLKGVAENTIVEPAEGDYRNFEFVTTDDGVKFVLVGSENLTIEGGSAILQLPTTVSKDCVALDIIVRTDKEEGMNGDVNHDGTINVADIATIISIMAGKN